MMPMCSSRSAPTRLEQAFSQFLFFRGLGEQADLFVSAHMVPSRLTFTKREGHFDDHAGFLKSHICCLLHISIVHVFLETFDFHIRGIERIAYEHFSKYVQKLYLSFSHWKLCLLSFDLALALPWYTSQWLCKSTILVFAMESHTRKPFAHLVFICFCHC